MTTRRKVFAALALAAAAAVAGCLDALAPGAPHRSGTIGIVPVFEGAAGRDGIPADVDSISVTIHNPNPPPPDTTVGVRILPGQDSIVITIEVPLSTAASDTRTMSFQGIRTSDGAVLYSGSSDVTVKAGLPSTADSVRVRYVGPGQNIKSLTLSPHSAGPLKPGDTFSAWLVSALDSTGATIIGMPVLWRMLDPSKATVDAAGVVHALAIGQTWLFALSGARATVYDSALIVVATTPVALIGLAPTSASFTAAAGGGNPAAQTVAVTNAGVGALTGLSVSGITYGASETTGWLTATLDGSSAPATLTLQPATGSLAAGTYHATVSVASALASNSPQTVSVTFTVAAGPTIALAPTSLTFNATALGADPASQTVAVTNSGGGSLTGLAVGTINYVSGSGWITTASLNVTTAPATLTVHAATGALAAGTYTATIPITSPVAGNSPQTVSVTFTVAGAPAIALAPTSLTFNATALGADPASQTVAVTNSGGGSLTGLAVGTINYVSGSGWITTASLNVTTAPATLTVHAATGALAAGTYTATIPITSPVAGNSPQSVSVTFTVAGAPAIALAPTSLTFSATALGADPASQTVAVTNSGSGSLTGLAVGTINYVSGSGWITTASLNVTTAPATLTVHVATSALPAGTYTATIPITSPVAGNSPQTVSVTFTVVQGSLVRIAVTPGFGVLQAAGTLQLAVQGFDAVNGPVGTPGLQFVSRTPGVASVDPGTGLVTAVAGGTAVIVASAPGSSGTVFDSTLVAVAANGVAVALPLSTGGRAFGGANVGDTVHVIVAVNIAAVAGEKLGSYTAQLNWDPAVLQYVSTAAAGFAAPTLNETATGTGQLIFGAADPNGTPGPTIALVDVKFFAGVAGASPLSFGLTDLTAAGTFTQMLTNALVLTGSVQVK